MNFFDFDRWEEIWQTIKRNKKRSIMTAFGVFWGVFLLVLLLGIGLGLKNMMTQSLSGMSSNSCFVFVNETTLPYKGMPAGRIWQQRNRDVEAIRREVENVKYVCSFNFGFQKTASRDNFSGSFSISGYMPEYNLIDPRELIYGRYLNKHDIEQRRKVCVVGMVVYTTLFPEGGDPVGKTIFVNNSYYTVIGVIEKKETMMRFTNPEKQIMIPLTLFQQIFNIEDKVDAIIVTANDDADMAVVEKEAKAIISKNNQISPLDDKALRSFNLSESFEKMNKLLSGISLLTWVVGIGTLLAGIVGVSNIMLVLVKERTQEIGIRRALGARPQVIISQVLSESFVLTFIAGILGLTTAVGVLSLSDDMLKMGIGASGQSVVFSFQITFTLGILCAVIIAMGSIIAGIIPASRALKIKAVDALRDE